MVLCNLLGHETMTTALALHPFISSISVSASATPALLSLRVASVREIAADVCLFELHAVDGAPLPPWTPGAHIRLHLPGDMARSYSLCNTPHERDGYRIAVKREAASRGGSSYLHEHVLEGDVIVATAPANAFALADDQRAPLLLAAGIGITPIYAMAAALADAGRSHRLHYFARGLQHAAFFDALARREEGLSMHLGLDVAETQAAIRAALAASPAGTPLYVCGPSPFIEAVREAARKGGWRDADVHFELFSAPASAVPNAANNSVQDTFELVLQRSGVHCTVQPGQSIVAAAAGAGVHIATSCGEGFCGSCESVVLDGEPAHRDSVLSAAERAAGRRIMPCVSRCTGPRLVLDL